jgi:hypothetical protein
MPGPDGDNQLTNWITQGWLKAPDNYETAVTTQLVNPHDEQAPLSDRARSWLDVNCAMCHQPNGPGNAMIDLRLSTELTQMGLLNTVPTQGDLGIPGAKIIKPGAPELSILLRRISVLDEARMPSVGVHMVDERGVELIADWIKSLKLR